MRDVGEICCGLEVVVQIIQEHEVRHFRTPRCFAEDAMTADLTIR